MVTLNEISQLLYGTGDESPGWQCSGQLIPDTVLSFSSVFAGANPSLN